MADDLVTWLRGVYDEDERLARAAAHGGRWRYSPGESIGAWMLYDEHWCIANLTTYDTEAYNYAERMPAVRSPGYVDPDTNGRHIARHDPASVLADIEAKRAIIDLHRREADYDGSVTEEMRIPPNCTTCHEDLDTAGYEPSPLSWPCPTLRLLASAYRDRPGYREEWAPSV